MRYNGHFLNVLVNNGAQNFATDKIFLKYLTPSVYGLIEVTRKVRRVVILRKFNQSICGPRNLVRSFRFFDTQNLQFYDSVVRLVLSSVPK